MRTRRAALSALFAVVVTAGVLLGAGSAFAGGPTSALLVEPGSGRSASLTYVDQDYTTLMSLVGADDGSAGRIDQSGADHARGPAVSVTWLIHNVSPWRVDHIYVTAEGGPWIATHVATPESDDMFAQPAVWHTAGDGPKLMALLERLGLIGGDANALRGERTLVAPDAAPEIAPAAPAAQEAQQPQAAASDTPRSILLWTAMLGLALGAVLTAVGTRLTAARSAARRSSGQPMDTAPAERDRDENNKVPDDITWSPREELLPVLERR